MKINTLLFLLLICWKLNAQTKFYNFNLYDGTDYFFTMNQSNDLMLNGIRLVGNAVCQIDLTAKQRKIYFNGLGLFTGLIGQAITHEEGHRSVLSELGIGATSKPFIDKNFVAKVTGVTNATLLNLRNTNFPNYIRLHTAGLESDYSYLKKSDAFFNFNEEGYDVLYADYIIRQFGTINYYLTNLYMHKQTSLTISENGVAEENRDIVGHDLFGAARHLHRPSMTFYRYTEWDYLTTEEKLYAKRMGFMSLLNLLNPNIYRIGNFNFGKSIKGNFSLNYSLAPFGDFVEQNVFLNINNKWKINPYLRQYFNKNNTFWASGIHLHNFVLNKNFLLNSSFETWEQPRDQSFTTADSDFGMGIKAEIAYRLLEVKKSNIFFNIGTSYKTKGFIPASPSLDKDFRVNFGLIIATSK